MNSNMLLKQVILLILNNQLKFKIGHKSIVID